MQQGNDIGWNDADRRSESDAPTSVPPSRNPFLAALTSQTTILSIAKYGVTVIGVVLISLEVTFTPSGVPVFPEGGVPWWGYALGGLRILLGVLQGAATQDAIAVATDKPTNPQDEFAD